MPVPATFVSSIFLTRDLRAPIDHEFATGRACGNSEAGYAALYPLSEQEQRVVPSHHPWQKNNRDG